MLLYEQKQNRGVNKFFHSQRYKNVQKKFREKFPIIDKPITILDIGCGTAKLFNVLNEEFKIHYTGVELREDFIAAANERYGEHKNFEI